MAERKMTILDWQAHYNLAVEMPPQETAGRSGISRACPLAMSLSLLSPDRLWVARPHTISAGPYTCDTPAWASLAMGKVDIRGRGKPVSWGQWTAILVQCQPPEGT